ncbi:MAG TPA: hypothetical protein VMV69_09515 [Pirellulales bacterium]|nr:hypothetical protein [Pirellulales bacterium]
MIDLFPTRQGKSSFSLAHQFWFPGWAEAASLRGNETAGNKPQA